MTHSLNKKITDFIYKHTHQLYNSIINTETNNDIFSVWISELQNEVKNMSNAKQAFTEVREATRLLQEVPLSLKQIRELKKNILGWDSAVTNFRKFADEQIKVLPRSDEQKKMLRSQKADLSVAVKQLRSAIAAAIADVQQHSAIQKRNKDQDYLMNMVKKFFNLYDKIANMDPETAFNITQQLMDRQRLEEVTQQDNLS